MPVDMNDQFSRGKRILVDAFNNVLVIYAEQGLEPFKKPLAISVLLLLSIYLGIFQPLAGRIRSASVKLAGMMAVAQEAGSYPDSKKRMLKLQAKLPLFKDKDDWLSYLLANTARKNDISFDAISAQKEETIGDFILASREVEFVTGYDTLGRWLADIENSPISVRIASMVAKRDRSVPTNLKVSLKLSTLFVKPGANSGGPAGGKSK